MPFPPWWPTIHIRYWRRTVLSWMATVELKHRDPSLGNHITHKSITIVERDVSRHLILRVRPINKNTEGGLFRIPILACVFHYQIPFSLYILIRTLKHNG